MNQTFQSLSRSSPVERENNVQVLYDYELTTNVKHRKNISCLKNGTNRNAWLIFRGVRVPFLSLFVDVVICGVFRNRPFACGVLLVHSINV